jgi:hypothetical protein
MLGLFNNKNAPVSSEEPPQDSDAIGELSNLRDCFFLLSFGAIGITLGNLTRSLTEYLEFGILIALLLGCGLLCLPAKESEYRIRRRWAGVSVFLGFLLTRWDLLGQLSVHQIALGAGAFAVTAIVAIAFVGSCGGGGK